MAQCKQCGVPMNPIQAALGPVCGQCCRDNHKKVVGKGKK